jgi:hypothetical protein
VRRDDAQRRIAIQYSWGAASADWPIVVGYIGPPSAQTELCLADPAAERASFAGTARQPPTAAEDDGDCPGWTVAFGVLLCDQGVKLLAQLLFT